MDIEQNHAQAGTVDAQQADTSPALDPLRLITFRECWDRLRVSRMTLYREIDRGNINPLWIGDKMMFTSQELGRYIAQKVDEARVKTAMKKTSEALVNEGSAQAA